jgi:Lrp/AsnC family transcriptional regulator
VALVNRAKVGLPVTVFVSIRTNSHDEAWLVDFARAITTLPEVVEVYRMSGEVDYLLKVVTSDIEGYDRFYKRLIRAVRLTDVSSAFAMEQIKCTTEMPLAMSDGQAKEGY